jgi:DNA invertase Pin-like site-specific DNA recombinase
LLLTRAYPLAAKVRLELGEHAERQLEGIAKAKAAGVYKGRKPTISSVQVKKLKDDGLGATEIAKRLGIGRASVYRALG